MALSHRQKLTIVSLLFYWLGIFVLTHIPIPQLVRQAKVSDKALHLIAYLVLVLLFWFAINPDKKVNWRKAAVWWILPVVVWYGAFDEWLQGFAVGRSASVKDFLANLAGVVTGLVLFSFFSFWPALLVVTGIIIFLLTNLTRVSPADLVPTVNALFHLFAYGFFTMLWIRYINHFLPLRAPQPKWLIGALALPAGLLAAVKLFSVISGRGFELQDIIISLAAIVFVVITVLLTALLRKKRAKNSSGNA